MPFNTVKLKSFRISLWLVKPWFFKVVEDFRSYACKQDLRLVMNMKEDK